MVIIFVFTGSSIFLHWQRKNITTDLINKGKTISFFISQLSVDPFLYKDPLKLDNIAGEAVKEEDVVYAFLQDSKGNIITSTLSSVDFEDPLIKGFVNPEDDSSAALEKLLKNSNIISVKTPVTDGTNTLGNIVLGLSKVKVITKFNQIIGFIFLFGIITVLFLSVSIFFMFRHTAVVPIRKIIEFTENIEKGIFADPLRVKGSLEIASLISAVNSMSASIKDMLGKIGSITDAVSRVVSTVEASSDQVLSRADEQKAIVENTICSLKEVSSSAQTIASNISNLHEEIANAASSLTELNVSIDAISQNVNISYDGSHETAASIEEMAASIKQIAEHLQNLSVSSDETSTAISEISSSVNEVTRHADESVQLAETVSNNASQHGMKAVNGAMQGISVIKDVVNEISTANQRLLKKSYDIGKIVGVIEDVADQTTLLAINAAILAAKAGEHGKGFLVVASAIRDLADRTTSSTGEIANLIGAVQQETRMSVAIAEKGLHAVEKGTVLFNSVTDALNNIIRSSNTSTEMAKLIQRATSQEAVAINQILKASKNILERIDMIAKATDEQTKGSKFIVAATEKMKEVSYQIRSATKEQVSGTAQISAAVEAITQQTASASEETQKQTLKTEEIYSAMEKINRSSEELMGTSQSLSSEINLLKSQSRSLLEVLQKLVKD